MELKKQHSKSRTGDDQWYRKWWFFLLWGHEKSWFLCHSRLITRNIYWDVMFSQNLFRQGSESCKDIYEFHQRCLGPACLYAKFSCRRKNTVVIRIPIPTGFIHPAVYLSMHVLIFSCMCRALAKGNTDIWWSCHTPIYRILGKHTLRQNDWVYMSGVCWIAVCPSQTNTRAQSQSAFVRLDKVSRYWPSLKGERAQKLFPQDFQLVLGVEWKRSTCRCNLSNNNFL